MLLLLLSISQGKAQPGSNVGNRPYSQREKCQRMCSPIKTTRIPEDGFGSTYCTMCTFRSLANQVTLLHLKSHFRDYPWSCCSDFVLLLMQMGIQKARLSEHIKKSGFVNDSMLEKRLRHHMKMQKSPSGHDGLF